MESPDVSNFWLRDVITTVSISIWILKKLVEGNTFPLHFFEKFKFPSVLLAKMRRFYQSTFLNLSLYKYLNFWNLRKSHFSRTTGMKVNILSDRTSSFSVFFERPYFFVAKHLPIRSSFLKLFCSKNELLDWKLRRSTKICSIKKNFFAMLLNTSRYRPAFFPTSHGLRKTWKTCSNLSDWLISKAPHSASRCPPGRVQMLSLL